MTIVTGSNTIIKENLLMKETIRLLDKKLIIAPRANTMYEGELKQKGDTVSVQTFPNIAWNSATTAGAAINATAFTIAKETLTVDTLATFRVKVSNLEEIQSNLSLATKVAERMMYQQKDVIEQFIVSKALAAAEAGEYVGGDYATALTKDTVYAAIESMRVALSTRNAFNQAALFVKPATASLIRQSALFDGFREGLDVRKEGFVGRMSGFEIYETNNVGSYMLAMDKDSVHFVAQWTGYKETEETNAFSWNILGEMAYGAKVFTENSKRLQVYYTA